VKSARLMERDTVSRSHILAMSFKGFQGIVGELPMKELRRLLNGLSIQLSLNHELRNEQTIGVNEADSK
jgi:hypothetical protein